MFELPPPRLLGLSGDQETLPDSAAAVWDGPGPRSTGEGPAVPIKVLLIDDNEALAELARAILGQLGREVHIATTGAEGRTRLQQIHPDVVICDINLPDGLGYEVLATLRQETDSAPPFIFMSGCADIDIERCSRLGAAAVVNKPCLFADLDRLIAQLNSASGLKRSAA